MMFQESFKRQLKNELCTKNGGSLEILTTKKGREFEVP